MPQFSIQSHSRYSAEETYNKIKDYISSEQENFKNFDPTILIEFNDSNHSISLRGKKFKAQFDVQNSSNEPSSGEVSSNITVNIDIHFILSPLKGKITSLLQTQLKEYLS